MKITIVTPTFNSAATIRRNIESVRSQTYSEIEHLFIDNESSDETREIIKSAYADSGNYRIISEKDQGISDAFSKGVIEASGDVVAILNSDDEYFNSSVISNVMNAFSDPAIYFVHGDMEFLDDQFGSNIRRPLLCDIRYAMPYNHPSFFVRKKLYQEIGVFKLEYRFAMDFEWVCRLYKNHHETKYGNVYLNRIGPLVRMHAGGASDVNELKSIYEVERALKEHGFWDLKAQYNQLLRRLRIKMKTFLSFLGLSSAIKVWRKLKWG
jgi:glycosyltransferase involved in cell wall biosynthesis